MSILCWLSALSPPISGRSSLSGSPQIWRQASSHFSQQNCERAQKQQAVLLLDTSGASLLVSRARTISRRQDSRVLTAV